MDKDSIRLVNIVPVVNGWKTAALENKREAQKLMNSGNIPDYNAGLVKSAAADLVAELADIYLCSIVLFGGELDDDDPCNMCDDVGDNMVEIMEQKLARWKYRLMKKEAPNVPEE